MPKNQPHSSSEQEGDAVESTRPWLDARVRFFRKKTGADVRDAVPTFNLGDDLPGVDGSWSGVLQTWGRFGAKAVPLHLSLDGEKARVDGRSYRAMRLGHRLVLTNVKNAGSHEFTVLTLDNELVGTWRKEGQAGEVYLVRDTAAQCSRNRFSERGEGGAVLLIGAGLAWCAWYFLHFPVWLAGLGFAGVPFYLQDNLRRRRQFHQTMWALLFQALTSKLLQSAAQMIFTSDTKNSTR